VDSRRLTLKETETMTLRVAHITIYGRDLKRMIGFYHEVLGLPLLASDEAFGYARVDGGSVRIGLGAGEPNPEAGVHVGIHTGIAFEVPDIEAAYEALTAKGVVFSMPPKRQGWGGTMAMFLDPDGNVLQLIPDTGSD
jgi:predicted enzyme related to lactoylglutathione lyase